MISERTDSIDNPGIIKLEKQDLIEAYVDEDPCEASNLDYTLTPHRILLGINFDEKFLRDFINRFKRKSFRDILSEPNTSLAEFYQRNVSDGYLLGYPDINTLSPIGRHPDVFMKLMMIYKNLY